MHVVGKGVIRFHAVYWPAFLLSAREPLPTAIFVHDYLTFHGQKLSKSAGASAEPAELVDRYGADALRWWFLRDVPRAGDTDFREELVAARADELADEIGNLINRVITLVNRHRPNGLAPVDTRPAPATALQAAAATLGARIDAALAEFDFRAASGTIIELASHANRFVTTTRPWELARGDLHTTMPRSASWTPSSERYWTRAASSAASSRRSCPPPHTASTTPSPHATRARLVSYSPRPHEPDRAARTRRASCSLARRGCSALEAGAARRLNLVRLPDESLRKA